MSSRSGNAGRTTTTTVVQVHQQLLSNGPTKSAAMNACISVLQAIGKAPSTPPSLKTATDVLVQRIERIEAEPSCNEGWKTLTEKLSQFEVLVNKFAAKDDMELKKALQLKLTDADKYLRNLISALRNAQKTGKDSVKAFFSKDAKGDSIYTHINKLDKLVANLKGALYAKDGQNAKTPSNQLIEGSNRFEAADPASVSAGAFGLDTNVAEDNVGAAFADWGFKKGMNVAIEHNTARGNKDRSFANITFT